MSFALGGTDALYIVTYSCFRLIWLLFVLFEECLLFSHQFRKPVISTCISLYRPTVTTAVVSVWDRELSSACLSALPQLSGLTQLTVSPSQLSDQTLLRVTRSCFNLQRLTLVDDRYSEHVCRQAADSGKVYT